MPTEIVNDPLATCVDPEHAPPMHISIPPGKMMRHTCPTCGKVTTLRNPIGDGYPLPHPSPWRRPWTDPWQPYPSPRPYRIDPDRPYWERPIVRWYC